MARQNPSTGGVGTIMCLFDLLFASASLFVAVLFLALALRWQFVSGCQGEFDLLAGLFVGPTVLSAVLCPPVSLFSFIFALLTLHFHGRGRLTLAGLLAASGAIFLNLIAWILLWLDPKDMPWY